MLLLQLEMAPPPFEYRFGSDASTLGKTKEMNSRSGPRTVVHEVVEHIRDVVDCCRWIGVCQDFAESVEGRVPLERVLVQIWYPSRPHGPTGECGVYLFVFDLGRRGRGGEGRGVWSVLISKKGHFMV